MLILTRVSVAALALAVTGFGPCSKSSDPGAPAPSATASGFTPASLTNDKGWWGKATGTGKGGGKWELTISNCSKDPLGPWLGHYTFTANQGGVNLTGESTSFPPITFQKGFAPVPVTIKVKLKSGGVVKVDIDSTAQLTASVDPMTMFHFVEKGEQGSVTAKGPQGETASLFAGGAGGKGVDIPLTASCEPK